MGLSRQAYWSGLPFPSPGDLPDTGIKSTYPALQVDSLPLHHLGNAITTALGTKQQQRTIRSNFLGTNSVQLSPEMYCFWILKDGN